VVSGTAIAQIDCIVERDTSNYVLTWLEAEVCTIAAPHVFLLTQACHIPIFLPKANSIQGNPIGTKNHERLQETFFPKREVSNSFLLPTIMFK